MNIEILGTLASIIILVSFMMKDIKVIRIINVVGSVIFLIYGFLTGSFSIILLNSILILVHIYYLKKRV